MRGHFIVLAFPVAICVGSTVQAAPDKAMYELQERCGKSAAAMFAKDNPTTVTNVEGGQTVASFENHYDPDLNKCFLLERYMFVGTKDGHRTGWNSETLTDVNDNKEYGNYLIPTVDEKGKIIPPTDRVFPLMCQVHGTPCLSEQQWRQLIEPFMGSTP